MTSRRFRLGLSCAPADRVGALADVRSEPTRSFGLASQALPRRSRMRTNPRKRHGEWTKARTQGCAACGGGNPWLFVSMSQTISGRSPEGGTALRIQRGLTHAVAAAAVAGPKCRRRRRGGTGCGRCASGTEPRVRTSCYGVRRAWSLGRRSRRQAPERGRSRGREADGRSRRRQLHRSRVARCAWVRNDSREGRRDAWMEAPEALRAAETPMNPAW